MKCTKTGDATMKIRMETRDVGLVSTVRDGVTRTKGRNAYGAQEIIARSSFLVFFCSLSWSSNSDVVPILDFFLSS